MQYDKLAVYYDHDIGAGHPKEDKKFYLRLAKKTGSPILELGCGTGRITIPLLEAGYRVVGIDSSGEMLRRLKNKTSELKLASKQLKLHHSNMANFNLKQKFPLIIIPFCSFQYLLTRKEQDNCLSRIYRHLSPKGVLALELFIQKYDFLAEKEGKQWVYERYLPLQKIKIKRIAVLKHKDFNNQINYFQKKYKIFNKSGKCLDKFELKDSVRYVFRFEMENLLEKHGFEIKNIFGAYPISKKYDYSCDKMIFVASKN